jgi:hypothetical protein
VAGTSAKYTEQSEQLVSAAIDAAIAAGHCNAEQCPVQKLCEWASSHSRYTSGSAEPSWLSVYADALLDASCGAQQSKAGSTQLSLAHSIERAQPLRREAVREYSTADPYANHGAMGKALAARGKHALALQSFQAAVRKEPADRTCALVRFVIWKVAFTPHVEAFNNLGVMLMRHVCLRLCDRARR